MKQQFEKKELKKKSDDLSAWYTDVILKATIADYAPVKGCMVIRPYGYALWESVQEALNRMMKSAGIENAYFPLFIPYSLLEKEKQHVAGFSPELAVVTIGGGEELKDPLVVRPTSETIMYEMYGKWVQSWRDLPVLINQWNNVVRWEKRTYLFLRTTEFLWQEGHTAHETEEEAVAMVMKALDWYRQVYEDYFAVPVVMGQKSESEKFAGAKTTFTVEALMPDGKALQGGTSHNLGQNFSKSFDISFQTRDGKSDFVWQTSFGFSTRSLGGLFLTHGDDSGLVLPPKIASIQAIIIPIFKGDDTKEGLLEYCGEIRDALVGQGIRARLDDRDSQSVGRKFNEWEVKGVPIRLEIGPKEMADRALTVARRDTGEKSVVERKEMIPTVEKLLETIQESLFAKAKKHLSDNTHEVTEFAEFETIMQTTRGFIRAFWCEEAACEAAIKEKTKATTRCLPLTAEKGKGNCVHCGKEATRKWLFGQSY
ncbi:MAG: proline--tRNA ligase [Patescibacteria group bacterium]